MFNLEQQLQTTTVPTISLQTKSTLAMLADKLFYLHYNYNKTASDLKFCSPNFEVVSSLWGLSFTHPFLHCGAFAIY